MFGQLLSLLAHPCSGGKERSFMHTNLAGFCICVCCYKSGFQCIPCHLCATHSPLGMQASCHHKMGATTQQQNAKSFTSNAVPLQQAHWAPTNLRTLSKDAISIASSAAAASKILIEYLCSALISLCGKLLLPVRQN